MAEDGVSKPEDYEYIPFESRSEEDPEFQDELFSSYRERGMTPDDLWEKKAARQYREWLKNNPE